MVTAEEHSGMTLDPEDLNKTDEGIFRMLTEGRCTPRYIAGELDLQQPYVNQRLKRLVEHGHVTRVDRGLYELDSDPREPAEEDEQSAGRGVYEQAVESEDPAEVGHAGREPASSGGDLRDRMEAKLEDLNVPGRPPAVEETRREAIKFAWDRLREAGEIQPRDLANETFQEFDDDPDLGYSASGTRYDGYQLWDNCVRGVLRELPGVYPGSGSAGWKFREE